MTAGSAPLIEHAHDFAGHAARAGASAHSTCGVGRTPGGVHSGAADRSAGAGPACEFSSGIPDHASQVHVKLLKS